MDIVRAVKRGLLTVGTTIVLAGCGVQPATPPPQPLPAPDVALPAHCVQPSKSLDEHASELGVSVSSVEHYATNDDSAWVLAKWNYDVGNTSTPPVHCITDQEQPWLENLVRARQENILSTSTLNYLLERHWTVGAYTNAAFEKTADQVRAIRAADPSSTQMIPEILQTFDYTTAQPAGNLPGTERSTRSDGTFFAAELPTNTDVRSWAFSVWSTTEARDFLSAYVPGLNAQCATNASSELLTQSMDVLFTSLPGGADFHTPVYNGSLPGVEAEIVDVGYQPVGSTHAWNVVIDETVPFDDRSKIAADDSIERLNLIRAPVVTNTYGHLFIDVPAWIRAFNGTPLSVKSGDKLGDSAHTILDFTRSIRAWYDYPQGDIPSDFPRLLNTVPNQQGLYIADPVASAFVANARALAGVPDDLLSLGRFGPRYWGADGPFGPGVFYENGCKPIGQ